MMQNRRVAGNGWSLDRILTTGYGRRSNWLTQRVSAVACNYPLFRRQQAVRKLELSASSGWLWKVTGMIATAAMVVGIVISCWFGICVQNSLEELAGSNFSQQNHVVVNKELRQQRDQLLARDNLQTMASLKLDLVASVTRKAEPGVGMILRP